MLSHNKANRQKSRALSSQLQHRHILLRDPLAAVLIASLALGNLQAKADRIRTHPVVGRLRPSMHDEATAGVSTRDLAIVRHERPPWMRAQQATITFDQHGV